MAEPDRPPGQRSLIDLGVKRVAEKRPPPEVDRAEVEQREQDAVAAAAAAKRPVGRPMGSGKKPEPGPWALGAGVRFGPCSLRD